MSKYPEWLDDLDLARYTLDEARRIGPWKEADLAANNLSEAVRSVLNWSEPYTAGRQAFFESFRPPGTPKPRRPHHPEELLLFILTDNVAARLAKMRVMLEEAQAGAGQLDAFDREAQAVRRYLNAYVQPLVEIANGSQSGLGNTNRDKAREKQRRQAASRERYPELLNRFRPHPNPRGRAVSELVKELHPVSRRTINRDLRELGFE